MTANFFTNWSGIKSLTDLCFMYIDYKNSITNNKTPQLSYSLYLFRRRIASLYNERREEWPEHFMIFLWINGKTLAIFYKIIYQFKTYTKISLILSFLVWKSRAFLAQMLVKLLCFYCIVLLVYFNKNVIVNWVLYLDMARCHNILIALDLWCNISSRKYFVLAEQLWNFLLDLFERQIGNAQN